MVHLLLDQEEMLEVDEAISLGIPRELALAAAGIQRDRMHAIEARARAGEEPYRTWLISLEQSEARAKVEHLKRLAQSPDWRSREKILALLDPSLLDGTRAEHKKTYDWMLRVIAEETDNETFERILARFATEEPGSGVEGEASAPAESELQ